MKVALVVETAEARQVHHICVLLGYGADGICPYLPMELAISLRESCVLDNSLTDEVLYQNYALAMQTGISKVMAKMGISTLQSYKGAQIFEAIGLADDVIEKCFKGVLLNTTERNLIIMMFVFRNTFTYRRSKF